MTVIRDAGPEDAETLQKIYDWYVRNTAVTFEYETPTAAQFRERMERTMERYPYLIAETDGRADGYCYAGPFVGRAAYDWSCELSIYLRPDVRRNGIGRMLYGEMEKRLRAMGIRNLYACIGVPRGEDAYLTRDSERFHKRMGAGEMGSGDFRSKMSLRRGETERKRRRTAIKKTVRRGRFHAEDLHAGRFLLHFVTHVVYYGR